MNEWEKLEQAIQAQEALRVTLGDAIVDATITTLREKQATIKHVNQPLIKQRKYITVLFADVSGFTKMSENMDAEMVGLIMKDLWDQIDEVILQYGGLIDKHMGDAVMALFGAPTAQENDPERAIRAALAMQTAVDEFCETHQVNLALRIGINSGQVILDVVGTTHEYTAMGDAVNLASRMETAAPVGGVLISQYTYQHVKGLFETEALPPIKVKGKSEPIDVYVIQSALPHIFTGVTRGLANVKNQMIGRQQQLQQLQDAFVTAVAEQQLQMITIVGEVGLGKTRLLREFSQWLTAEAPLTWYLRGRTTHTSPYALIRTLFSDRFDIRDQDNLAVVQQKLEQGIVDLLGDVGIQCAHFIGHLIGYDFTDSPYLRDLTDEAHQIYEQALQDMILLLQAITQKQPVAIFLEDVHWADDESLDFLLEIALRCQNIPLLIVLCTRPSLYQKRPYWGEGRSFHTRLDLKPLSHRDSQRLVNNILHQLLGVPPAPNLRDLIVDSAEGNPFYMEELIHMFNENGTLAQFEAKQDVRVPPTLFGVLQARLDRLATEEQTTIQQAAIVGRVFWDKAIQYLRQQDDPDLPDRFEYLRQYRFIEARVPSTFADTHEYRFHNSLLYDTAYESVLITLRQQYHHRVATWLVDQYGTSRVLENASEIAFHYEKAGANNEAAVWYGHAGDQAAKTYALNTAVNYYQKALALSPDEPTVERMQVFHGLGKVRQMQAQYDQALDAFQHMQTIANTIRQARMEAIAWWRIAQAQELQAVYPDSLQSAVKAEKLARSVADYDTLNRALLAQGWAVYRLNQIETALEKAHEARQITQQIGDARQTAFVRNFLLAVYLRLGHLAEAQKYGEEALAVFRALGDKKSLSAVLAGLGSVAEEKSEWAIALQHYQEMLTVATQINHTDRQIVALFNIGQVNVKLGQWQTGVTHLQQLLSIPESEQIAFLPLAQASLAQAYLGQEKLTEALTIAQQAVKTAQARNHPYFLGIAWQALALVLAQMPDPPTLTDLGLTLDDDLLFLPASSLQTDGERCFAHSAAIFRDMGLQKELADVLVAWDALVQVQGNMMTSHHLQEQIVALQMLDNSLK